MARRKLDKSWEEVRRALDILRVFCPEPVPLTVETHERAVHIAERHGYSIFDSLIVAAAIHAGASTPTLLWTKAPAAEYENHWIRSLQFGKRSAFGGVVRKLVIGEDGPQG